MFSLLNGQSDYKIGYSLSNDKFRGYIDVVIEYDDLYDPPKPMYYQRLFDHVFDRPPTNKEIIQEYINELNSLVL